MASRSSASKPRTKKAARPAAKKPAPKAAARSAARGAAPLRKKSKAPAAKAAPRSATRVLVTLPPPSARAPKAPKAATRWLAVLTPNEQRAVRQALAGQTTLLERSARARDAALFVAAASMASAPVLVFSPRASELLEQAKALAGGAAGVEVAALGGWAGSSLQAAKKRLAKGGALLLVAEPADLFDAALRDAANQADVSLLGIAGAHAGCEQAHELSPSYLSLRESLRGYGAPVLATCTHTTDRVVEQAAEAIGESHAGCNRIESEAKPIERAAQVVRATERKAALFAAISSFGGPAIVLTATSQEADSVFAELSARNVRAVRAHSGMAASERSAALERFATAHEKLVLVTQSPHANASGLAGCTEASQGLSSAAPRPDLKLVVHYQAPLSLEQLFEDQAWLATGGHSLVLADSSDAALVQALLAQQRIKPAAIETLTQVLAVLPADKPAFSDNLALRAGTSRRSAERVLSALADRNLLVRDGAQIARRAQPEQLAAEGRLLAARFAALRAADTARAEGVARYVTSRHGASVTAAATSSIEANGLRAVKAQ